jgi:DNA-binding NtrC family response regulator
VELTYPGQRNGNIENSRALDVPIVLATRREDDRRTLASLLAGSAWRLVAVNSPEEALAALRRVKIPIVLCDPDVGGDRWKTMVRSFLSARRGVRVLLLADRFDGFSSAENSLELDFLIRPLDRDRLLAALFFAYARCKTASIAAWSATSRKHGI